MNAAFSTVEPLESRIAPAVVFTFVDQTDNDVVQIVSNKAITVQALLFSQSGNLIELTVSGAGMDGADLKTVVKRSDQGDGFVNIGRIVASNLDLGNVAINGDVGRILVGNSNNALPAMKSFTARSMGALGLGTQGGMGNLDSTISGDVGKFFVAGDVIGGRLLFIGKVGTLTINGDLQGNATGNSGRIQAQAIDVLSIGGDLVAGTADETGKIGVTGNVGKLTIRGSVRGALDPVTDTTAQIDIGGNVGLFSIGRDLFGSVSSTQKAIVIGGDTGPFTINGTIYGGGGTFSGAIELKGDVGVFTVGGSILAGSGEISTRIKVAGLAGGFVVGGDVRGGSGGFLDGTSASHIMIESTLGFVRIGGSIIGGAGFGSAAVNLADVKGKVSVGGSVYGGGQFVAGQNVAFPSGFLFLASAKSVTIGGSIHGSAFGGGEVTIGSTGNFTMNGSLIAPEDPHPNYNASEQLTIGAGGKVKILGSIVGTVGAPIFATENLLLGTVKVLEIGGSVLGGVGQDSGSIQINANVDVVKIGGSLIGGPAGGTGVLKVGGKLGSLTVKGSLYGGVNDFTNDGAQVKAAEMGVVKIGGDLVSGGDYVGGRIFSLGKIASVAVGGSVYGSIRGTDIGSVKIGGNLRPSLTGSPVTAGIQAKTVGAITIGGDVLGNPNADSSPVKNIAIEIGNTAGTIRIGGDIRSETIAPVRLVFNGFAGTALVYKSLTIGGGVSNAEILGGHSTPSLLASNGDVQMGPITVGRDWVASTVSAGISAGGDGSFGTMDDFAPATGATLSRIAAITIKGQVFGTAAPGDRYAFTAESFGPVKIGGVLYAAGATQINLSPSTGDARLRAR